MVILFWCFSVFCTFNYSYKVENNPNRRLFETRTIQALVAITIVCVPVLGLLADVCIGRYRMVCYSLRAIWLGSIGLCAINLIPLRPKAVFAVELLFVVIGVFGLAGFMVSTVQLCMDQFHDASSHNIKSLLYFYYWTYCTSKLMVFPMCVINSDAVLYLIPPTLLTLALCSESQLGYLVIKEPPGTVNPLKLIFKVLNYARKNKYPRHRKAFTYCEDKPYSRIDLGKDKYGGPFSIEEVEDVKTFFRMTITIIIPALFYGYFIFGDRTASSRTALLLNDMVIQNDSAVLLHKGLAIACWKRLSFSNMGEILIALMIPLCLAMTPMPGFTVTILKKCGIGLALIVMCMIAVVSQQAYEQTRENRNETIITHGECIDKLNTSIENNPWLMICFSILTSIGEMLVSISFLEFICAQSPYSMKSLLFGVSFFCAGASTGVITISKVFFYKANFHYRGFDCKFWLLLMCSLFAMLLYLVFIVVSIHYKKRKRGDNLPNEHYFAEEYYEKLLDASSRH